MRTLVHVLSGLEFGGKERVAVELAARGRRQGLDHRLLLFDSPFRGGDVDFDPGDIPVRFLPRSPGLDLGFAWRLAQELRHERVDAVHAHNDTAVFYTALARMLMLGRRPRVVGTFHTRPSHATWTARRLTHWASRRSDGITAVSPDLAVYLQSQGWVASCDTVWNGVDLAIYAPEGPQDGWRTRLGLSDHAFLVGHIGRFDPVKRHEDLIDAARQLAAESDGTYAWIFVGQGPTREEAQKRARGIPGLHFVPRVVDVPAFLREIDLFVLCSEQEAAPRVLLEAMAVGRPIVASDVGGIREILTDTAGCLCGAIVPPADTEALAVAIRAMALAEDRGTAFGVLARRRALAFSAEEEWRRYRELFGYVP